MDELVGKTIVRVVDDCDERGLFFTDGTSMVVSSEDYLRVEVRSAEETRRAAAVAQGRRETARIVRLRRLEWLSVPCEERVRRRVAEEERYARWRETAPLDLRVMVDMQRDLSGGLGRQLYSSMLTAYWDGRPRKVACTACGEVACPNAEWTRR